MVENAAEYPISFQPEMVKAILLGQKTTTRRRRRKRRNFGRPGDILWVREATMNANGGACYQADETPVLVNGAVAVWDYRGRSRPSIHMRKDFCRLRLRVVSRCAAKLGDVMDLEAKAEGFRDLVEFGEYWQKLHGGFDPEEVVDVIEFEVIE